MTGRKLCPKIILEGTRLTFKTDIAFALNNDPRLVGRRKYPYHSPIVSAEWCAFTNFPWGRGLINFEPHEEPLAQETYRTWVRLFELQKYYSWMIDRFHISTRAYQLAVHDNPFETRWIEERLAPIGFRLVFLHRVPESFAAARALRLKVSGNPSQYDDIDRFKQEQELMRRFTAESILPSLSVDISSNNIEEATDTIAVWMVETGAIWADY
jgi:hypothetical protein